LTDKTLLVKALKNGETIFERLQAELFHAKNKLEADQLQLMTASVVLGLMVGRRVVTVKDLESAIHDLQTNIARFAEQTFHDRRLSANSLKSSTVNYSGKG
jgi:hypothetical protein